MLDGAKKFMVACSVTFYEQALVNAMRTNVGIHLSNVSSFQLLTSSRSTFSLDSKGVSNSFPKQNQSTSNQSLTDGIDSSELKTSEILGQQP